MVRVLILAVIALGATASNVRMGRGFAGKERERSLLQSYESQLAKNKKVTPVTRVVNLLKEMSATIAKEQEEDEGLYKKLACWCNDNVYAKKLSGEANGEKSQSLEATIEQLTARSAELKAKIEELEAAVAADKAALSEASALRKKQLGEFHAMELDSIAAIENLKAAIVVLSKHQDAAFPQIAMSLLQVKGEEDTPFGPDHESHMSFSFDEFLRKDNFHLSAKGAVKTPETKFLQSQVATETATAGMGGWSGKDVEILRRAVKTASSLLQARHGHGYFPSYESQSGEILGVLRQLKEEMEGDLKEAQKVEAAQASNFNELRESKTSEIESAEKMAETKEDEKAEADNALAEAKEDLGQTGAAQAEDEKFSGNLKKTCDEAGANFEKRKASRLAEIGAVSETIEMLTGDEAQDAMDTTFSFVQTAARDHSQLRRQAAAALRKSKSPQMSLLATAVELDAFTKVKEAINKMIEQLGTQQEDEVKQNDWCKDSLQENEMTTMKTKDEKADLDAKIGQLEATIKTLSEEIEKANLDISELRVALQRAGENRKQENLDFQTTVADQAATAEILNKALDKLATFYDNAAFTQLHAGAKKQAPPVPQMEYSKSKGATGIMSMIEKLIYDTKDITEKSKKSESEAQAAYETLIADTNESVDGLQKQVVSKTKDRTQAKKDLSLTQSDHADAVQELEELGKTNADLHMDCDYTMKNFMIRQKARAEEVEALQQAKQILGGADLS